MVTLLPSTATRTITVLVSEIATTLTIIAPASVTQGVPFTINGQLVRNDTGVALPNMSISVSYNGNSIGSVLTDMQGVYSITAIIPDPGTFTLKAAFAGATGYAASEAQSRISVSDMIIRIPNLLVGVVAPIVIGGILASLGR